MLRRTLPSELDLCICPKRATFSVLSSRLQDLPNRGMPSFFEEFDHAAFLGDEGVDAVGFGVEVVSDRPLLSRADDGYTKVEHGAVVH